LFEMVESKKNETEGKDDLVTFKIVQTFVICHPIKVILSCKSNI